MISAKAEKLFFEAQRLDPDTQVEFVTNACGEDSALLEEVSSLLASANQSDQFFEGLKERVSLNALAEDDDLPANTVFGQWRLLRLIGSGGMGSVYLAERADGEFEQTAALKVLPVGIGGKQGRNRFLTERQILARLNHENIARLLDGGVSENGVPFFVMDFVDGVPIDTYCATNDVQIRDCLKLVLEITDAVQYAHRNLVIHRDLKPGNVLIDRDGKVRLLDFGIAKVLDPSGGTENLTQLAQRPATPAYSSPEMLRGEAVDATTDVYSIGVLLYRLITGRLPIEMDDSSFAAMQDRVTNEIPVPAGKFSERVDGDLDTIIGKALGKTPDERYSSVEGLANDIRRYLRGEPVSAKAPSKIYLARKFVERHRVGVAFTAFAGVAITAIAGLAVYSAITSERQSQETALERDRAQQAKDFLVSIFDSADPNKAAPDLTAREILDAGRQRIATELVDQPELQVDLAMTIGNVYATFRMTDEWREMLDLELKIRRELTGTDDIDYVDTLFGMSQLEDMSGNYDESLDYAQQALSITERLEHQAGQAFAHMRLGRILHLKGDYDTAESQYRESLAINEEVNGARDRATNEVRMHLSTLLNHQEKFEEALTTLQQVYEIRQERFPGDHGEYSEVFLAMGSAYTSLKRYDEAIQIYERAYAMNDRLFGPDNRRNLFIVAGLGKVAEAQENYAIAIDHFQNAIRMTATYFPDHPNLAIATANLAKIYTLQNRFDVALPLYREAADVMTRKMPGHWALGDVNWRLGLCIVKTGGDLEEAEQLILSGIDSVSGQWGPAHERTVDARESAVQLYTALGRPNYADQFRALPD